MKIFKILIYALSILIMFTLASNQLRSAIDIEVPFNNDTISFSGTLSLPDTTSKYPLIILVTGSGPQNRDEEVFGFKVFKVLSDSLVKHGFAVYRYDDRGIGKSKGKFATANSLDFAKDAESAVITLREHRFVNKSNIGILGHSEGGLIAPIVYSNLREKIKFLILMAGPTVNGDLLLREQMKEILKSMSSTPEEVEMSVSAQSISLDYSKGLISKDTAVARLIVIGEKQMALTPDSLKKGITDTKKYLTATINNQLKQVESRWMKGFLILDPQFYFKNICGVKILLLFGEKDTQVPATFCLNHFNKFIEKNSKCLDFEIKVIKDANHLFQKAETGAPSEYSKLDKNFTSDFISSIVNWYQKEIK